MSFVEGFYSFFIEIINADCGLYESVRVKTARHPEEPAVHLAARALAYAHAYRSGIQFSEGLYQPDQPAIQVPDGIGGLTHWVEVGCPPVKKVKRALQEFPSATSTIYFYETAHIATFCHMLRGTRKNWIEPVNFYLIDPEMLEQLADSLALRNRWTVSFIDSSIYIQTEATEASGWIRSPDIWLEYQTSIGNSLPAAD